ncbi:MAG TPA: patatin-like phospholipase family protein [Stellaceae bacterium]|nr:patatin-like phospholipase family protein [Stellaceae bacterium]
MSSDPTKPTYVLVLQGGGALGAYHIGAYQALAEHGLLPDWVCGISIGAINAAIIAGNPPERRLERLEALWDFISWPALFAPGGGETLHALYNTASYAEAVMFGQPNFFLPRPINPLFAAPGRAATSFYDTAPLHSTLLRFADFAVVRERTIRLSLGATDIATGDLRFFDNERDVIGPEHVMASSALPPGFPPVEIDGRSYWDGGCVSNTPLEAVIRHPPAGHAVVFMIDLWSAAGKPPQRMNEVLWRQAQIQYASRTAAHIEAVAAKVKLDCALRRPNPTAGESDRAVPDDAALLAGALDIVHIVYHPGPDQIPSSGAEFSRFSLRERRRAGHRDMTQALAASPWLAPPAPSHLGVRVHRVAADGVTTDLAAGLRPAPPEAPSPGAEAGAPPPKKRKRA